MNGHLKYVLILMIGLIGACTPSQKSAEKAMEKEDIFNKLSSITLGLTPKYKSLKLPKTKLRVFFSEKFGDSNGFKKFKIITDNEADYYLIASGMREGKKTQFAVELMQKQGYLIVEDFDQLYYSCIAKYCEDCSFRFNGKGTIGGCSCEALTEEPPNGRTACEHSIGIKSSEKN